jgi:sigma-B regulation protein RsbU (phosphoserine phosphatase)
MSRRRRGLRAGLAVLAVVFAGAMLLYSVLWMVAAREPQVEVELGFQADYQPAERMYLVKSVSKGSPAEQAGMRAGDRIVAINDRRVEDSYAQVRVWRRHKPGDTVRLSVERAGHAESVILTGVFRKRQQVSAEGGLTQSFAQGLIDSLPAPFVAVGLAVLFLRLEDPYVWLLAFLFGSFATAPDPGDQIAEIAPSLRFFAMTYRAVFQGLFGPLFYWFFAVFPTRSPLDRRLPWLKWAGLALGICFAVPGLATGHAQPPGLLSKLLGAGLSTRIVFCHTYGFLILGLVSLGANYWRTPEAGARRKIRVVFWGAMVGVAPAVLVSAAKDFVGFQAPWWLTAAFVGMLFVFPLSFAYAVVKHRVLEIPVLLRRSARYLLVQRGFTFLLSVVSIALTLVFALWFARYLQPVVEVARPAGIGLGAVFGTVLLWGGSQVHRQVSRRIDRAFFRSAYDARVILENLAERSRQATDRGELARLLERELREALEPSSLVVYLREGDDRLSAAAGAVPQEWGTISAELPILKELAERGQPWEVPPAGEDRTAGRRVLAELDAECLVPVLGRGGRLVGLLVLGPRLSEEPYSREDKRLLGSVASQAGTALENIGLAEEIAERMERERRAAREMEIAKEVQDRLLPQAPAQLQTLECAAQCIQARAVGGDYYDFLDLGPGRAGLVLADVSGKGVHAALLMASLQAHLRSQSGVTPLDPVRLLEKVNELLCRSTAAQHYATLFFGVYEDATRRLVYANCGHNPAVWLRRDGGVERLGATATVIGLFEQWECAVAEIELASGDLLAVFSDGVTEAEGREEEFGEARLIELLRACRGLAVEHIVPAIFARVEEFSAGAQADDLTMLIARGRG